MFSPENINGFYYLEHVLVQCGNMRIIYISISLNSVVAIVYMHTHFDGRDLKVMKVEILLVRARVYKHWVLNTLLTGSVLQRRWCCLFSLLCRTLLFLCYLAMFLVDLVLFIYFSCMQFWSS